jgi:glutathione S-transferase
MAYRLFGSELSPYSVKVRAYFRYKGLEYEWLPRTPANQAEFQKYAKLPLVPMVVTPPNGKGGGEGMQDSTPIIERLEASHPEARSIVPEDPALGFIAAMLEEYADEWCNKWMFHYRWTYAPDCWSTAERIALQMAGEKGPLAVAEARAAVAERMSGRLGFVGSNPTTRPLIEASFKRVLSILDRHFKDRAYVFGGKPTLADFGLWGQLYECATDPTPGALMRSGAPQVMAWVERMVQPKDEGPLESWADLAPSLSPLLKDEVGALFLPWSAANAEAIARGDKRFTTMLAGASWTQEPQKYHARSLAELRRKYQAAKAAPGLAAILEETGCRAALSAG